jgi:hypothetical protein
MDAMDVIETTFKTAGRHPWRCRRTDRSRRAPANFEFETDVMNITFATRADHVERVNMRSESNAESNPV